MRQSTFFLIALSFLFVNQGVAAPDARLARIVAVVNKKVVTETDLNNRIRLAAMTTGGEMSAAEVKAMVPQILNLMIEELLQRAMGEEFGIDIDDTMVEAMMTEIESQNGKEKGWLKQMLVQHKIPLEVFTNQLRSNLMWREYIRGRYKNAIQVSDEEFQRYKKEFEVSKNANRYLVAEIVIHDGPGANKAHAQAQRLVQQIRHGASFMALAQQFSNAPSARRGGDVGWLLADSVEAPLREKLEHLGVGQVSDPIKTDKGYVILLVRDKLKAGDFGKPQTFLSYKQAMFPLGTNPFEFEIRANVNEANNFMRRVNSAGGCAAAERIAKGGRVRLQQVTKVPAEHLPPELAQYLLKLRDGKAGEAVLTPQGSMVFVLCAKETINPQAPTEAEMRETLIEKKLQLVSERDMRNRRRVAHIDIKMKMPS